MFLASDISAIKTGLTGSFINMEDKEVEKFVTQLEDLAGAVDGTADGRKGGDTLLREIYSNQVGGSEAGHSFAFHQSLARAKSLEIVHLLAETLRAVGATTEEYKRDVKRTDEAAEQDLRQIEQLEQSITNPDLGFDDNYPNGVAPPAHSGGQDGAPGVPAAGAPAEGGTPAEGDTGATSTSTDSSASTDPTTETQA